MSEDRVLEEQIEFTIAAEAERDTAIARADTIGEKLHALLSEVQKQRAHGERRHDAMRERAEAAEAQIGQLKVQLAHALNLDARESRIEVAEAEVARLREVIDRVSHEGAIGLWQEAQDERHRAEAAEAEAELMRAVVEATRNEHLLGRLPSDDHDRCACGCDPCDVFDALNVLDALPDGS